MGTDKTCNQWKEQNVFLGKNKEVLDAELWAISKGFETASKILNNRNMPVTIFCDLQKALKAIQHTDNTHYNENWFLRNLTYQKAKELRRNGHLVAIRWVPGHSGLIGNEKADFAARK